MKDSIKQRIIELAPVRGFIGTCSECDFVSRYGMEDYHYVDCTRDRPITLADILRAIGDGKYRFQGKILHFSGSWLNELIKKWNLTADFDGQSDEVKQFIGQLLCV